MNISLSWLRNYLKTSLSSEQLAEVLTDIGLEVESIERKEAVKGGLEGLVVGEVLTKEKHPDADRLSVTTVNTGTGETLQIVCGAANVAVGQKVIVACNGAKLFPSEGEPFVIKKSKIRGVESNGMICAEDEIGLGKSHEGIMVLDASAKVGTPAAAYFKLENDEIISIGLTPNRVDAASHYGVARDLYAALTFRGEKAELHFPDISSFKEGNSPAPEVIIAHAESCKRYAGIVISGVKVQASPEWLQNNIRAIGLRPINNIVDITNFVLHELGHPLHAFDAAKIKGGKVIVRKAEEGKRFVTLDEVEHALSASDTMICNAETEMCIAGVFGGKDSGVSESTTEVFLESAWFDPAHVRKTARAHGLNTDSSFRFERGADPDMVIPALQRAALLIAELGEGTIASKLVDVYPEKFSPWNVEFDIDRSEQLIGEKIEEQELEKILNLLEIRISDKKGRIWNLSVPNYRVDVQRPADVTEELLRIYGYNRIALPKRMSASLNNLRETDRDAVRHTISDLLTANGFYEMLSNSLTKSDYVKIAASSQMKEEWHVELLNPLSSELNVMRQTMLFSGLEAIAHNLNRKQHDLRLYEFGKIYFKRNNQYEENYRLSLFLTGRKEKENWNSSASETSFFTLKSALMLVFKKLGLTGALRFSSLSEGVFEDGQSIEIAKKKVAEFGWIRSDILKKMDIRQNVFYADVNWDVVLSLLHMNKVKYSEIPRFPEVRRDLSLLLDSGVRFSEIEMLARQTEKKLLREVGLFDVYEGKNLEAGKKSYALSFVLQDEEQTLTDQVIDQVMEKIRTTIEEKTGAQLRS